MTPPAGVPADADRRAALPALMVVAGGASVAPLDFAVNVAFPAMTLAFGVPTDAIRWVAVCYVLTYGSLMLAFGALGDRIGHLRIFRAGLLLGTVAFALCALAPSFSALLAARIVQGLAVALLLSCAPALATALAGEAQRTWALSTYGSLSALAALAAPLIGGASLAVLGWTGVYWIRVPICVLAFLALPVLERQLSPAPRTETRRATSTSGASSARSTRTRFDTSGTALLAAGVAALLLAPALLGTPDALLASGASAAVGATLILAFIQREGRRPVPFLPATTARSGAFWIINAAGAVVQFSSFAVPLISPYYLLRVVEVSPMGTGALLSVWALGSLLGAGLANRMIRARGGRPTALAAALLVVAGLAGEALWPAQLSLLTVVACLAVQGFGLGLFQVAYADLVVEALPVSARGVAGSLTMVTRTVGIVLGASIWIGILQSANQGLATGGAAAQAAFMSAFSTVHAVAATVTAVFFTLTLPVWIGRDRMGDPSVRP